MLKGAALIGSYYDDAGTRALADVDVLVPLERERDSWRVVREAGLAFERPDWEIPLTHHVQVGGTRVLGGAELHWYSLSAIGDDRGFWKRAVAVERHGVATRMLSPTDQLLHLCAHGLGWSQEHRLQWVVDSIRVLAADGGSIDWDRLVSEARTRRIMVVAETALRYLGERTPAVPTRFYEDLSTAHRPLYEKLAYRARMRPASPLVTVVRGWERRQRLRQILPEGIAPPGILDGIRGVWVRPRSVGDLIRTSGRWVRFAARLGPRPGDGGQRWF